MRIKNLLLENKAWSVERMELNPNYFSEMAKDQTPNFLWIGCADSRVNPSEITGTSLGDMFVHRNIANLIHENDLNVMSVLTYGIEYLNIRHVIVCGHYGCGGVKSAMTDQSFGIIDGWLANIKNQIRDSKSILDSAPDERSRVDKLVEINVMTQVKTLAKIPFIASAVENKGVSLHGWVYDLSTGLVKDLITVKKVIKS